MNLKSQKKNKWKNKYETLEHASKFHHRLQEILLNDPFSSIDAFQEVEINSLVPETSHNLFIDWYLPTFNLCIELHGMQHYKPISFIKQDKIKTQLDFNASKNRDSNKKYLLENSGFLFLEIPYTDYKILDKQYLLARIENLIRNTNDKTF